MASLTPGFSGAEIENLLNEAMLYALRENRNQILKSDIEIMTNRILTGWQITENKLSEEMIKQVAVHEIGHALVSIFTNYKKILKVTINLWSPKALGFTMFDESINSVISTKETLLKEIMVLLGGRVAEEIFYGNKISSGAVDDFHRVKNILQRMVIDYGMGTNLFLPQNSDKYTEKTNVKRIFLTWNIVVYPLQRLRIDQIVSMSQRRTRTAPTTRCGALLGPLVPIYSRNVAHLGPQERPKIGLRGPV